MSSLAAKYLWQSPPASMAATIATSAISMNWRGRPLTSHQVVVDLIAATTTRTGLKVRAKLDEGYYPTGVKVSDKELAAVPLTKHDFHGEWNYTIGPRTTAA